MPKPVPSFRPKRTTPARIATREVALPFTIAIAALRSTIPTAALRCTTPIAAPHSTIPTAALAVDLLTIHAETKEILMSMHAKDKETIITIHVKWKETITTLYVRNKEILITMHVKRLNKVLRNQIISSEGSGLNQLELWLKAACQSVFFLFSSNRSLQGIRGVCLRTTACR